MNRIIIRIDYLFEYISYSFIYIISYIYKKVNSYFKNFLNFFSQKLPKYFGKNCRSLEQRRWIYGIRELLVQKLRAPGFIIHINI